MVQKPDLADGFARDGTLCDFNSSINVIPADYDSRIYSNGGTASNGNGNLTIESSTTKIIGYSAVNMITPNFYINNNLFRYIPPTTYTPDLNTGSCVNRSGSYTVMGGMMTVQITFNTLAGGTAGVGGIYQYSIPLGFAIKSVAFGGAPTDGHIIRVDAETSASNVTGTIVGNGYIQERSVMNIATVSVVAFTNTTLSLYVSSSRLAGYYAYQFSTQFLSVFPYSSASMFVSFTATFPID